MKKVLIGAIMDGKAGGIDRYILNFFGEVQGNQVHLDFYTNKIDPQLQKNLSERGAELFEVASLKNPFQQYKDFKRLFKEEKFDTVYFNFSTALTLLGPMVAKKCGVQKIIIHSHTTGCDITNPYKRKLMTVLHSICRKFLYRYGTDFYACSKAAGEWMFPQKIVDGKSFRVVNNAVSTEDFVVNADVRMQMRQKLSLENCFVVGHIGNFVYQKNHAFLLRAFAELTKEEAAARLLLIGDGALYAEMQVLAQTLGIADKVLFAGRRSDANLYLQAMDVFAFPSNFEGLGIVAIEAQASGLPCLCSDRVPKEACVTDLCTFLPIDGESAVSEWVHALQKSKGIPRTDQTADIVAAGYDLKSQDLEQLV